jgi:hypothetical protein
MPMIVFGFAPEINNGPGYKKKQPAKVQSPERIYLPVQHEQYQVGQQRHNKSGEGQKLKGIHFFEFV